MSPLLHAALPQTVNVPGTANIFSAGLSSPVAPAGGGAGTLPVSITLTAGAGHVFQFNASGNIVLGPSFGPTGPEGYSDPYAPMNINSYGGISGYYGPGFALLGVFLTDAAPSSPPPATLDFTGNGQHPNFLTLSPTIGQLFFIGDGNTYSGGTPQSFTAPANATRLFLGLPDCNNAAGDPGYYGDNSGSLSVTVSMVPEPASGLLFACATAALFLKRRGLGC
jgi:hypothetical protein